MPSPPTISASLKCEGLLIPRLASFVNVCVLPSLPQVEILVDSDGVVEAGTLGAVETRATFYDTRMSEDNGCDPDGCVPSFTRVSISGAVDAIVRSILCFSGNWRQAPARCTSSLQCKTLSNIIFLAVVIDRMGTSRRLGTMQVTTFASISHIRLHNQAANLQ